MPYGSQQHTPLWSLELYAVMLAMWAFWQADYCGLPGMYGWPPVWLITRPYLLQRLLATGGWD